MLQSEQLPRLIDSLRTEPAETEWLEFKHNNDNPQEIGEYISALSNSAALHEKPLAFMVWGIENGTHAVVGSSFPPGRTKKGNEDLIPWLARGLSPQVDFVFHETEYQGHRLVVLEISPATTSPVGFYGTRYVRVGSYKKKLADNPALEKKLWTLSEQIAFEDGVALADASSDSVLELLDYPEFFQKLKLPLPDNREGILSRLLQERFIAKGVGGHYNILNVGALLFARELSNFHALARKSLRIVFYDGPNRTSTTLREHVAEKGYAVGFEGAVNHINENLPWVAVIEGPLRQERRQYPEIALRELVANALIHQDLNQRGPGLTVEVFTDRIEVTNPGKPLIDPLRFIDEPPRSRNEGIAAFMRRIGVCEELGTGIDKVVQASEAYLLPAPDFQETSSATRVTLYGPKTFAEMGREDRIRACYQHACLCAVSNKQLTNPSLRERFAISSKNAAMVTRVINDTIDEGLIKPFDPNSRSKKFAKYVPYWA